MQQRPYLDPETQRLWDEFVDRRCMVLLRPFAKRTAERVHDAIGKLRAELVKENKKLRAEIKKLRADKGNAHK